MKIYHYIPGTKIFSGTGEADKNPVREGSFIIPAFATSVEPPSFTEEQQAFWNSTSWEIQNKPVLEPDPDPEPSPLTWQDIEMKRDGLLRVSDWRVLPDANLETKELWLAYREILRNITETFSTPESVIWPIPPES